MFVATSQLGLVTNAALLSNITWELRSLEFYSRMADQYDAINAFRDFLTAD